MKSDTTTTALNFTLAALVILGVVFAILNIIRVRELRQLQTNLQFRMQAAQVNIVRAQSLANDVSTYNTTAKSVELANILKGITPQQPAAK
jgi:competence protein ComGC